MTTWADGDYPAMAACLQPAANRTVEVAHVRATDRVLDIATGTGNAAIVAAGRGAQVIGTDFEPALLTIAEERALCSSVVATWEEAEATELPIPDEWADVVLSVFGVMYAADHDAAARELARCVRQGGRVVLASWVAGSVMPAMGAAVAPFLPPPPTSSGPPSAWGDPAVLAALLEPHDLHVEQHTIEQVTITGTSVDDLTQFLVRTAGHVLAERDRLVAEGRWDDLADALHSMVAERAAPHGSGVRLDLDYLLTLAVRSKELSS